MAEEIKAYQAGKIQPKSMDKDRNYTSAEVPWFVLGAADEDAALQAVAALAPATTNGLYIESYDIDERLSPNSWAVTVAYGSENSSSASSSGNKVNETDPEISVTIGNVSVNRKEAIERIAVTPGAPSEVAASKAINVNAEGRAEGVDVIVGNSSRALTYYFDVARMTAEYEKLLNELVGKVNLTEFMGYAPGELRFDGASYSFRKSQKSPVKITFNFSISPNVTHMPIGSWTMTKSGWDVAWVKNKPGGETTLLEVPEYACIDRVAYFVNFAQMGINI